MLHERFDLARWTSLFPLSRLRAEARDYVLARKREFPKEYRRKGEVKDHIKLMSPRGTFLGSARDLAATEQLRLEALGQSSMGVATDVFVWSKDEPADRAGTRIGGLPYLPRSAPWPRAIDGRPLRFTAQLCFADSRDIVPELPGDILLIFGSDDDLISGDPRAIVCQWVELSEAPLVDSLPAEETTPRLTPYFGTIHRTKDLSDSIDQLSSLHDSGWQLAILEGTKIGGVPARIQGEPEQPRRFIGAIGSISYADDAAIEGSSILHRLDSIVYAQAGNDLMIGDMGSLSLYLQDDGSVLVEAQYY